MTIYHNIDGHFQKQIEQLLQYHFKVENNQRINHYAKSQQQQRETKYLTKSISGLNEIYQSTKRQLVKIVFLAVDEEFPDTMREKLNQLLQLLHEQNIYMIQTLSKQQLADLYLSQFNNIAEEKKHGKKGIITIIALLQSQHIHNELIALNNFIMQETNQVKLQFSDQVQDRIVLNFEYLNNPKINKQKHKKNMNPFSKNFMKQLDQKFKVKVLKYQQKYKIQLYDKIAFKTVINNILNIEQVFDSFAVIGVLKENFQLLFEENLLINEDAVFSMMQINNNDCLAFCILKNNNICTMTCKVINNIKEIKENLLFIVDYLIQTEVLKGEWKLITTFDLFQDLFEIDDENKFYYIEKNSFNLVKQEDSDSDNVFSDC